MTLNPRGDLGLQLMRLDATTYLPDDILTKVDRAAMSSSLEVRVPFLDRALVEFCRACRPPFTIAMANRSGFSGRPSPATCPRPSRTNRPKMGFGVPIGAWLRGPLRDWAESLLDERRLMDDGFLHHGPVWVAWSEHLSGRVDRTYELWDVLCFQAGWNPSIRNRPPGERQKARPVTARDSVDLSDRSYSGKAGVRSHRHAGRRTTRSDHRDLLCSCGPVDLAGPGPVPSGAGRSSRPVIRSAETPHDGAQRAGQPRLSRPRPDNRGRPGPPSLVARRGAAVAQRGPR